jgi:hypothetical protein
MKQKNVQVFKIEYEIPPKLTHFSAYIAALSHEESIAHLKRVMGPNIFIQTSGLACPLHDITPSVRKLLTSAPVVTPVIEVKKNINPQVESETKIEEDDGLTFKSGRGRKSTSK